MLIISTEYTDIKLYCRPLLRALSKFAHYSAKCLSGGFDLIFIKTSLREQNYIKKWTLKIKGEIPYYLNFAQQRTC